MGGDVFPNAVLDSESRAEERPDDHKDELRLWLRLVACTHLIEGEVRTRLRERFDVTLPRFDLMAQLERASEGMTLGEISRRMMVSNGNITGLVERLVEMNLIERSRHPTDRRAAFVRLTPTGRASFDEIAREHAEWIASMMEGLTAEEIGTALRLLQKMKTGARSRIDARREAAA